MLKSVALFAFVAGAVLRPDAALGLVVLGAFFAFAERVLPRRDQPTLRKGVATDAVHFLVDELLAALILGAILLMTLPLLGVVIPEDLRVLIHRQPRWLALAQGLLLAEVAGYWGHRTSHELPALWRFHKLHHTIELMDWLAPNRRHPVDMALARASVVLVIAPLGFAVPTIAAHFAIKRFQGLLVHANVRLNAGLLTWLVATPEFHHWHHADEPRAYNKNYAGQLPVVDLLFGTLYMPRPSWPTRYGCGEVAPEGYVAQLMWPFRRSALVAPISTRDIQPTTDTVERRY